MMIDFIRSQLASPGTFPFVPQGLACKGIIGNPHALWAQEQYGGFEVDG
jgi:hypothetical protein